MSKLQPARGTHDLLPEQARLFRHITDTALEIAERYGCGPIETPIFEFTHVFTRSIGETTDIVSKEMYTFEDRGGSSLCLRPEGTAGVVRSFISEGLSRLTPLKLFYSGPMFRYERPQKGRYRQFYQLGVEFLGVDKPQSDIEVLVMANDMLSAIGLAGRYQLEINTLGDFESRQNYRSALTSYFEPLRSKLSEDSQTRLDKNPLRILDSKAAEDQELLKEAPQYPEYLTDDSKNYFQEVLEGLEKLGIAASVNDRLVRGLDYYDHTVFEFTTTDLGTQNAILSGGRYNGLVESMGGKSTPAIGFAAGIDRLAMMVDKKPALRKPLAIVPGCAEAHDYCMSLAHKLRQQGHIVDMPYTGNFAKRLKKADKVGASHALIIGEDELKSEQVTIKNLQSGEQVSVARADVGENLPAPATDCFHIPLSP